MLIYEMKFLSLQSGLTPYKFALYENQHEMAEFLIHNVADEHSELEPNSSCFFFTLLALFLRVTMLK